eukprot:6996591-Ditylum_brightwellii.AAC.1
MVELAIGHDGKDTRGIYQARRKIKVHKSDQVRELGYFPFKAMLAINPYSKWVEKTSTTGSYWLWFPRCFVNLGKQ